VVAVLALSIKLGLGLLFKKWMPMSRFMGKEQPSMASKSLIK
jgi:hypothetical protein